MHRVRQGVRRPEEFQGAHEHTRELTALLVRQMREKLQEERSLEDTRENSREIIAGQLNVCIKSINFINIIRKLYCFRWFHKINIKLLSL